MTRGRLFSRDRPVPLFLPWKVVHLSLGDAWSDLEAEPGIGGLLVMFWRSDQPLGHVTIGAGLLPVTATQLATIAATAIAEAVRARILSGNGGHLSACPDDDSVAGSSADFARLARLEQPLQRLARVAEDGRTAPGVSVSVVVCTNNRPASLDRCLRSIRALTPAPHEVVVVDRDPASGITPVVTARFPDTRYLAEPRAGLAIARNTGVRGCNGSIIAFTQDDAIVHSGWIGAIGRAFSDPHVMGMRGLTLPAALDTPAQQVFRAGTTDWTWGYRALDFDASFGGATGRPDVPRWPPGAGANMAFKREAFGLVGLFDQRLGAGAAGSSEDSEMWHRLLANGQRCHYAPSAVVFAHPCADWDDLRRQLYSHARGEVAALLFQFERHRYWKDVYQALVALPWHLIRLATRSLKQQVGEMVYDPVTAVPMMPVVPQVLGTLAGYGYYVRHSARQQRGNFRP